MMIEAAGARDWPWLDYLASQDAACERTVAGGRCTLCERDAPELVPWATAERLCWGCVDVQLDLLARAIMDAGPVPVTLEVAA
jgi:hypothetical protein